MHLFFLVVIEEAAEILEAHVVTALAASCEHLIMIGESGGVYI